MATKAKSNPIEAAWKRHEQSGRPLPPVEAPPQATSGSDPAKSGEPQSASEAQERAFWESHDSAGHIDWDKARRVRFPNLKPSTTAISLRLPVSTLERIKIEAHKRDVPYQSLIKTWLADRLG
ncbi:MAG TPA: BrnA antitoxin family protein [Terriglobales bacterium]|nr:BrnA antitoxin family protein [Terriglobales bacterium]